MLTDRPHDLYRAIFEASPDGVLVVDADGRIRELNERAERLFGYAREELLGETVEVLVPEPVRDGHRAHRQRYAADAHPRPMGIGLELKARRKDGVEVPVEISLSPLESPDGLLTIATVRDVTQRKRLRDFGAGALRASEEERKRIARELHDDTAQHLATLLVRLRLIQNAGFESEWEEKLEGFREELQAAAEGVRRIARGLRPPELEDAGVVAAIRSHLRVVQEATRLTVRVEADPVDGCLDPDAKLVLYRIVQEAVSNASRHAKASELHVRVLRQNGHVVAEIADDGTGFQPAMVAAGGGAGLGLVSMHERAAMVGGDVKVETGPGRGTRVRVRLPVRGAGARASGDPSRHRTEGGGR